MSNTSKENYIISAFFLSVFFSFINTPFYFDPAQINNQPSFGLGAINIPLQLFPLICIFFYFLGFTSRAFVLSALISILLFLIASMPEMPNHRYVLLVVTSFLFVKILGNKDKILSRDITRFSQEVISIIYFFSFMAKLNSSYLNPQISCATIFYENVKNSSIGFLPSNTIIHLGAIYSSLIFEGLAFLFIFKRNIRIYIVLAGLLFHLGLSLDLVKYFTNFSGIMYFLLFSSLGEGAYICLKDSFSRLSKPGLFRHTFQLSLFAILILCLLAGLENYAYSVSAMNMLILFRHILWLSVAFFAIISVIKLGTTTLDTSTSNSSVASLGAMPALLLVLFSFNCLGPYLGYKTRSALTMYSNLRMESDYSNHYLFTKSINILGYLGETAKIIDVQENCSTKLKPGLDYPLFEISRLENMCPGGITKIQYLDREIQHGDSLWLQIMERYKNTIQNKLLVFGPVGEDAEKECVW